MAWLKLVPGMRRAWSAMSPSSRLGMNSEPMREAIKAAEHKHQADGAADDQRARASSAQSSAGSYQPRATRMTRLSFLVDLAGHEHRDRRRHEGQARE